MSFPPSRRNKYSSYYNEQNMVDYNIMAPLNTPGYSFPCKGYRKGPVTHTFESNAVTISLEGTVTHGGGHCQFGISFDDSTFIVLKTIIRDCLLNGMTFQVIIPDSLPNNEFTLFWTWVNAIGNREYYMECADVSVQQRPKAGAIVYGKQLIVVNLPGYTILPEFPQVGMYDGRELFLQADDTQYPLAPQFPRNNPVPKKLIPDKPQQPQEPQERPQRLERLQEPQERPQRLEKQEPQERPQRLERLERLQEPQERPQRLEKQERLERLQEPQGRPQRLEKQERLERPQEGQGGCEPNGFLKCSSTGFSTCDHNNWVYRDCAPGTSCKPFGNSIICDYSR